MVRRSRKGRRGVVIALVAALLAVSAATARLFLWPVRGMPARVSAIVMLDSPGNVQSVAVRLAEQHRAPFLVISRGSSASHNPCPRPVPGVRLICFIPRPPRPDEGTAGAQTRRSAGKNVEARLYQNKAKLNLMLRASIGLLRDSG